MSEIPSRPVHIPHVSRRDALRLAAAGAVAPFVAAGASSASAEPAAAAAVQESATVPAPAGWVVRPFANDAVSLSPSLFTANRDRVLNFLRNYSADRMLAVFRANARLDTRGAQPPGGWETADGNLRGHYAGHFLSALALAYADSGDQFYRDKVDYMVSALGQCQDALDATVGRPAPPPPPVQRVAGVSGNGVRLNGSAQQYADLPDGIVNGLAAATISVWVNPATISTWSRIFDFGTGTGRYMFLAVSAGSAPRFAITTAGSGGEQRLNGVAPLPLGQWTHLAVTLTGSAGMLYVNGDLVATNSAMTLSPGSLGSTANNWLGRSQFGDPFLNASLDEFALFDRALTADEIRALAMNAGDAPGGTVAWYRFEEADGPTAADSSGHGHDATLVGGPGGAAGPSHAGYLAAYPETQFILLEQFATYPSIWAPWYTCHMIMRGLLDAYELTGNAQALDIAAGMADWAYSRLAHLPREQLDRMWGIYIGGEYNAMPSVLADILALTGDERHLTTAKAFINTPLFQATLNNDDRLDGRHANQHIPQFLGYLEIFNRTGEGDFHTAAANFWDMVVPHRTYTDGGMAGSGEIFGPRDVIVGNIQTANAETCPCYNMLKLSRGLFFHNPDPKYMQYYERALYGQILASRQNADSATNPLLTYFVPMNPGARRSYGNLGTCCGGTGLESHTKFQDSIYFQSADGKALYVNLYLPSTLHWQERGFTVAQSTQYPTDPSGTVRITIDGTGPLEIRLRVPYWVERGFTVRINGVAQDVDATAGTYVGLSREWTPGDVIDIAAPFSLRIERALDDSQKQSLAYGPVPLVIRSAATAYQNLGFYQDFTLSGDFSGAMVPAGAPLTFTTGGLAVGPFYIADTAPYHGYFTRVEPRVVFGAVDSGVTNYADPDGFSFLDRVWARAPFATKGHLVRAVEDVSAAWVDAGLLTSPERQAVLTAAARAFVPA